jgi:hypothetical protein
MSLYRVHRHQKSTFYYSYAAQGHKVYLQEPFANFSELLFIKTWLDFLDKNTLTYCCNYKSILQKFIKFVYGVTNTAKRLK